MQPSLYNALLSPPTLAITRQIISNEPVRSWLQSCATAVRSARAALFPPSRPSLIKLSLNYFMVSLNNKLQTGRDEMNILRDRLHRSISKRKSWYSDPFSGCADAAAYHVHQYTL